MKQPEGTKVVLGAVLVALGLATPFLLQCDSQLTPRTAAEAFQGVCLAAIALEAEKRHVDLTDRALRYCADPGLPARIVMLVEMAQQLEPELAPVPDAGR